MPYTPPLSFTPRLIDLVSRISESLLETRMSDPANDPLSDPVSRLLSVFQSGEQLAIQMMMDRLGLKHRTYFRRTFLNPALKAGKIAMTEPDSPHTPKQRYRIA